MSTTRRPTGAGAVRRRAAPAVALLALGLTACSAGSPAGSAGSAVGGPDPVRGPDPGVAHVHGLGVAGGTPIYFGGGKLAADLTLPKLQRRWEVAVPSGTVTMDVTGEAAADHAVAGRARRAAGPAVTAAAAERGTAAETGGDRHRLKPQERARIWEQATAAAGRATEQVRAGIGADPRASADAAWAASDFLSSAARVVEGRRGGPLTVAATEYDRAARELWGHTPPRSSAGQGLRTASVLLSAAQFVGRSETKQLLALPAQLASLTDAVTGLREAQDRAAQAAAARRASEQLRLTAGQRATLPAGHPAGASLGRGQTEVHEDAARGRPHAAGPDSGRRGPRR